MEEKTKIDHLERIINNLNEHWHSITLLLSHVSKPLLVDDRGLANSLRTFREEVESLIDQIRDFDIAKTMGEIKFIGKRLDEIERLLLSLNEKGMKKEVVLSFSCDGYELVKKPMIYDRKEPIEQPLDSLKSLLDSLDKREANVLNHRYGLLGESEKTLVKTGRVMGISGERVRVLEARALRKCRAVCRKELVSKLTHKKLYKDITGNDLQ